MTNKKAQNFPAELMLKDFEEVFDPEVGLLWQYRGKVHDHKQSLSYVLALLERGRQEDIKRATFIIEKALTTQNTIEGTHRYGNFKWLYEDEVITDINAVQFCLWSFIEIVLQYDQKLDKQTLEKIKKAIAIGLIEEAELDVPWHYTNITLIQIANMILGAELLGPKYHNYSELGYQRLREWIEISNSNGAVFEYNSPGYCAIDIEMMTRIAMYCLKREIVPIIKVIEERLWIHVAIRFHSVTTKLAGPYARAYQPSIHGVPLGIYDLIYEVTKNKKVLSPSPYWDSESYHSRAYRGFRVLKYEYNCPQYIRRLILEKCLPYYVREVTDSSTGNDITTYLTEEYALGTNAKTFQETDRNQPGLWTSLCKSLILHYRRRDEKEFGVLYSLYVVNDQRIADYYNEIHGGIDGIATADRNQDERGLVRTVQHLNKAIVLYHPPQLQEDITSLRTEIIVLGRKSIDRIYIHNAEVKSLPMEVKSSDIVFLQDSSTYIALMPLEPTNLGEDRSAPLELIEDQHGNLVFSIYNYRGPKKPFWEYKTRMPYFRSNAKSGFVIEIGSSHEFVSFKQFREHISNSVISDVTSSDFIRKVSYKRGNKKISLRVDLKTDALMDRYINGKLYHPPLLSSNTVKQDNSGRIELNGSLLITDPRPTWFLIDEEIDCYVVATTSSDSGPLKLITPNGTLECANFGFGRIAYFPAKCPRLEILAQERPSPIYFDKNGTDPTVFFNGEDISSIVEVRSQNQAEVFCLPALLD